MRSVLFNLGPLSFSTIGFFSMLAFLSSAFIFWRKTKEEHYDQQQAFDAFLLASLVGLVIGRIIFVMINFKQLGLSIWNWIDVVANPGSSAMFGLLGASIYLYKYAKRQKWDVFELLDFWFLAVAGGLVLNQIGSFVAGIGFGYQTNLPWGMIFPGVFEKYHPVQLYGAIFYVAVYLYLNWAEFNYRTFSWYRFGKKTAQTGFLTGIFIIASGAFLALIQLVKPAWYMMAGINFDLIFALCLIVFGAIFIYVKSSRRFLFWNKKH